MEVFYKLSDIEERLSDSFARRYQISRPRDVALTGILLARPEDEITRDGILPNLNYWHHRADQFIDFFCAGYVPVERDPDAIPVGITIDKIEWGFSVQAFVEIVQHIERQTKWTYAGDPCLILANSRFDGTNAYLDFRRSMRLNFREVIADKAIATPTQLAEAVFQYAQNVNASSADPVWEFSDSQGLRLLKKGAKEGLLAWLPKWFEPSARAAFHFVVHEAPA